MSFARLSCALLLACALASSALASDPVLRKVRDFNGDGKDDIVWRNPSTEQAAVWTMNGLAGMGAALYQVFPYIMRWTGDFDGDGKTDILFRSNQFGGLGEIAAWLMNGTAPAGSAVLLANPDWIPTHVADLDGDGKDDIVWRQGSTNNVAVWLMNGLAIKSSAVILAGQPNWQVEHTRRFRRRRQGRPRVAQLRRQQPDRDLAHGRAHREVGDHLSRSATTP